MVLRQVRLLPEADHAEIPLLCRAVAVDSFWIVGLCSVRSLAQVDRSALTGTVTDPSGKLLPGTKVTATMPATGLVRDTVSSAAGEYLIPNLAVGSYVVTFEHAGFAAKSYDNVIQTVARTQTLNTSLRVLGGEEHVEVSTESEILDRNNNRFG